MACSLAIERRNTLEIGVRLTVLVPQLAVEVGDFLAQGGYLVDQLHVLLHYIVVVL